VTGADGCGGNRGPIVGMVGQVVNRSWLTKG
jgi:hypothetical protein